MNSTSCDFSPRSDFLRVGLFANEPDRANGTPSARPGLRIIALLDHVPSTDDIARIYANPPNIPTGHNLDAKA